MEDVIDDIGSDEALTTVCGEAAAALMMFETMVEAELGSGPARSRLPIAKRLSHQHRMHPAIARLVSSSFYDGTLLTDDGCRRRYVDEPPPFTILDCGRLPASPIVFVDMPYVQSTLGRQLIERQPRYHNPEEVDAVTTVLSLLLPKATTKTSRRSRCSHRTASRFAASELVSRTSAAAGLRISPASQSRARTIHRSVPSTPFKEARPTSW